MRGNYQTMTKEVAMKILGLPANYTESDLRRIYREKMKINHPDHNGDERLAQEINLAYDFLKEKYPSANVSNSNSSYIDLRVKEVKNMVIGCDESLPEWLKEIYNIITFTVDDIDLRLINKTITKEQIDKTVNAYRNEVIKRLKEIEEIFCRRTGITKNDLINKGYIPINNYSMQYNVKDIYNKLLVAYAKIFKDKITVTLSKYSNQNHGSLEQSIEDKISELNEKLLSSKLNYLLAEFDTYLNDIYRQYEYDKNLVVALQNCYPNLLNQNSKELNDLYALCGKKEFNNAYNELIEKLKYAKKEQDSAALVFELNRKFSYALSNIGSLQETIKLNKLYGHLLDVINSIDLTDEVIGLIAGISIDNIEKDMSNILQLLDIKINDIYISRFRTDISVPLYVSCRLCDKEYFIKVIYQNGLAQAVEEVNYDDNKQVSLEEVLKLSTFVGGTKTANVNNNNSVICEYNDPHLNRFGLIKNKNTNTIEAYGSKKYISYSNGKKPEEDLAKYHSVDTVIAELTKELTPSVKRYLYEESKKNNGRSK